MTYFIRWQVCCPPQSPPHGYHAGDHGWSSPAPHDAGGMRFEG